MVCQSELRLSLFGAFELTGRNGPIDLGSKKLVGLVAFLACMSPEPQSRERLMALLWGSRLDAQARQSLRQALARLRRVLGPSALISNAEIVSLDPDAVICDVTRFEALIRLGSRDDLAEAVDLYRHELLAGVAIPEEAWTEWLDVQRQRLENVALDAMIKLGECELQAGDAESALRAARRAITINNLREDAHRLIIRALAADGRRVEGLKHYDHLFAILEQELNVRPDFSTKALVEEIRAEGEPAPQPTIGRDTRERGPAPEEQAPERLSLGIEDKQVKDTARAVHFFRAALGFERRATPMGVASRLCNKATSAHRPSLWLAIASASVMLLLGGATVLTKGQFWEARNETALLERMAFSLPDKPSIAVLPFANLGSDAAQDFISEGLTESLVSALARNPAFFVIAHASTSTYAGHSVAAKRAAEELGVRYIVEGSVKRADNRVRVMTKLVDTLEGSVLWSERYERTADDFLALEEEITTQIARSLDVRIIYGTKQSPGGTHSLDAWAAYVQGRTEYLKFTGAGNLRAREDYLRALEVDPNYAEAMVAVANTYFMEMFDGPADGWGGALAKIAELEAQAARIAPRMPRLHELRSLVALTRGDYDVALSEAEAMAELDPNGADSHYVLGRMYFFAGEYERAIDSLRTAERINPHTRASYSTHLAFSQLALGRTDVAISIFETVAERWPDFSGTRPYLAIAYQLAGRDADARRQIELFPHDFPVMTMLGIERRFSPMQDRRFADRIFAAARQAGIPD